MAEPTAGDALLRGSERMAETLRAGAAEFVPKRQPQERALGTPGLKVRTFAPKDRVLATLDAVPFTPSQGVCTPTPTHVMVVQQPVIYGPSSDYSPGWAPMGSWGSPHASSSGQSDGSCGTGYAGGTEHSPASSQPGTPYGRPLLFSSFYFPMPFSPRALQQAAAAPAGEPRTPPRAHGSGGGGGSGDDAACQPFGFAPLAFAASPGTMGGLASPGQLVFTQFFAPDAFESAASGEMSDTPPEAGDGGLAGSMGAGGSWGSSDLDPSVELTPAARQIAAAMCAAQNLQGPPPAQLVELASLLQAYGLVNTSAPSPPPPASSSPEKQQQVRRTKSAPRTNPDGTVRLNARQRRTLRRAQERAIKALMDMQTQGLGIDGDQAAANMAAMMGMQPMVFGSPPHCAAGAMALAPPPHSGPAAVQLPPMSPMQAVFPAVPVLPPAPHMLAGGWAGLPAGAVVSQPLVPGYPADHGLAHSLSMPLPLAHGHGAHGHPAMPALPHGGFDFAAPNGPPAPAMPPVAGGPFGGGARAGATAVGRAASAPLPHPRQGGGSSARGGRLSRFAPGGSGM